MSGGIFISSSTDFGSPATPITIDGMPNGTGLQILRRNSGNNAIEFVNLSSILPSGTGLQILRKNSANTDFEFVTQATADSFEGALVLS